MNTNQEQTMPRFMTADEFIVRAVNAYPSLYASNSRTETKFRILDHVLNTIGNGLYLEDFVGEPLTDDEVQLSKKWFACKRAAYGFMKTKMLGDWEIPDGDAEVVVPIAEMQNYPNMKRWVEFDCAAKRVPYPNFSKQYSAAWDIRDINFKALGPTWAEAAIWFYERCRKYFANSKTAKTYSHAFPRASKRATDEVVEDYKRCLSSTQKYPTNDDITKAYNCEFVGDRTNNVDVAAFVTRRWEAERARILYFIDETIEHLKDNL